MSRAPSPNATGPPHRAAPSPRFQPRSAGIPALRANGRGQRSPPPAPRHRAESRRPGKHPRHREGSRSTNGSDGERPRKRQRNDAGGARSVSRYRQRSGVRGLADMRRGSRNNHEVSDEDGSGSGRTRS
jgi:hypothetical protein